MHIMHMCKHIMQEQLEYCRECSIIFHTIYLFAWSFVSSPDSLAWTAKVTYYRLQVIRRVVARTTSYSREISNSTKNNYTAYIINVNEIRIVKGSVRFVLLGFILFYCIFILLVNNQFSYCNHQFSYI